MNHRLETWLTVVTKQLALQEADQIRTEIVAHVECATAHHQLEGMTIDLAYELAINELGSPVIAGRKYQQVHLTVTEMKMLQKTAQQPQSRRVVLVFLGLVTIALIFHAFANPDLAAFSGSQVALHICLIWSSRYESVERRAFYRTVAFLLPAIVCLAAATSVTQLDWLRFIQFALGIAWIYPTIEAGKVWQKTRRYA